MLIKRERNWVSEPEGEWGGEGGKEREERDKEGGREGKRKREANIHTQN
jgi:hypothetical protein